MKTLRGICIAHLFSALIAGTIIAGCGGSSGTTQTTTSGVASGQGSMSAVVSAVKTSMLSNTLRNGGSALFSTSISPSANLANCSESVDSGSGSGFSVTCSCIVDNTASGSITTVFGSGRVEQSCQSDSGSSGTISSISGSVTVSFDNCVLDVCGERLTINGSIQGTIEYSFNACTSVETVTASLTTEDSCSGVTVTHSDNSIDTVGFSATWTSGTSGDSQGGSACINGGTTSLSGLDDICNEQSGRSCSESTISCASDFACQLFAEKIPGDAFNTDNVICSAGCCVASEKGRCSDSKDNDSDKNIDCSDSDCSDDPYCVVGPCGSGTASCANDFTCQTFAETNPNDQFLTNNVSCVGACCVVATVYETGQCRDAVDNDSDGAMDCNDSDCAGDLACGARLPCTNEWQCRAIAFGSALFQATPSCIRYPEGHQYYRYNDGSCNYDCKVATSPSDCMTACQQIGATQPNGAFYNFVDKSCRFYPPPH